MHHRGKVCTDTTGFVPCRFSFDDMLDLRGNTAVYMLYAHARIASIIRKVGKDPSTLVGTAQLRLDHPAEVALAMHIARFPEAVEVVLDELAPNRLTEYVYDLAEKFSVFYQDCKVALLTWPLLCAPDVHTPSQQLRKQRSSCSSGFWSLEQALN